MLFIPFMDVFRPDAVDKFMSFMEILLIDFNLPFKFVDFLFDVRITFFCVFG